MRRYLIIAFVLLSELPLTAQKFPDTFLGTWKGPLNIYKGDSVVRTVTTLLEVYPADSGRWDWIITYGDSGEDRRHYTLVPIDTAKGHWAIDENNGIVIDMFVTGNKVTSLFSVEGSMIQISYWIEGEDLMMELFVHPEKELNTSGKGTEDSPTVKVWKFTGYQMARMKRLKGVK